MATTDRCYKIMPLLHTVPISLNKHKENVENQFPLFHYMHYNIPLLFLWQEGPIKAQVAELTRVIHVILGKRHGFQSFPMYTWENMNIHRESTNYPIKQHSNYYWAEFFLLSILRFCLHGIFSAEDIS